MAWTDAALEVLGVGGEPVGAPDEVAMLERWIGGALPEAVREWFLLGGDRRLAAVSSNLVTTARDFGSPAVGRFLDSGHLLLETELQHCCRWVVAVEAAYGDPPVYLVGPDDDACVTRSRYAAAFSEYVFAAAWDAVLWAGEMAADFDHPLPAGALEVLKRRLTALPVTYGWAMNQECDAVHRFEGEAKVAVAVTGGTAVWSAVAAPDAGLRRALAELIGADGDV
ncbi:hypothetical protein ACQEVZ_49945 [Dactylosporangium sp. CA-152071]|uniref:hypothetical protein n=1 Tax=Dactylosporangium sp. CA-152071 TaxID=3239933 RepID=UPI003D91D678